MDIEKESFGFIHCHLFLAGIFEKSTHRKLSQPFDHQEAKKRKLTKPEKHTREGKDEEKSVRDKKNKEGRQNGSGCTLSFDIPCFGDGF